MTTTPTRPSLARKVTPASERKRNAELDSGIRLTIEGRVYEVRAGDMTALDSRELRKQVGCSFSGLLTSFHDDPDIDLIAALMWLARRIEGETLLRYDDVASEVGYGALDDLEVEQTTAEEVDGSPEK